MSANPNQTNINATTTFYGGGGGTGGQGNFPNGIKIGAGGQTNYLQIDPTDYWGQPILAVENTSNVGSATSRPFLANPFFAYTWDGANANTQKSGSYSANQILYQGNAGSGDNTVFLNVNDGQLGGANNAAFALNGVSSITVSNITANAINLLSSLKGTFPTSFI